MRKAVIISDQNIESKIYLFRKQKVMLDSDLAILYGVKAIRLREQVKRNLIRFPENFMFQLTTAEVEVMVSQNAIPSRKHLGGFMPYVFTEHGVLMLANVLKSARAIEMSIKIIEIFVRYREQLSSNKDILLKLENLERKILRQDARNSKQESKILLIFKTLKKLINPDFPPRKKIGFKRSEEKSRF